MANTKSTRACSLMVLAALLTARCTGSISSLLQRETPPIGTKIPQLKMDLNAKSTISGLSAGAAWSVQFAVAFSKSVGGAAIFSGKCYHCMKGDCISNCSSVHNAHCHDPESEWGIASVDSLVNLTRYAAGQGFIDDTLHMAHNRYYFFRGRSDTVYLEGAMNATLKYFSAFAPLENIRNEIDEIDAAHTIPTLHYGNPCTQQGRPFINNCGFDGAGQALQFLYNNSLRNRNDKDLPDQTSFMQFNQTALGSSGDGMFDFGMAYIPRACLAKSNTTGNGCRLHLHFHGTRMNIQGCDRLHRPWDCGQDEYGRYVSTPDSAHSGFNNWAEANKIVVVYPQTSGDKWDNAGDSGDGYAWKSSAQMTTVQRIMQAFHGEVPGSK